MTPEVALIAGLVVGYGLCEWRSRSAMHAANEVYAASTMATSRILAAAQNEAKVAGNIVALTEGVNELEAKTEKQLERLATVVDAMDVNQGAVLAGLVNSGIIRSVTPGRDLIGDQVGERPRTTMPERTDRRVPPLGEDEPALR